MGKGPENKFRDRLEARLKHFFGPRVYLQKNHGSAFSSGLVDLEVVLDGMVGFYELKATVETMWDPSSVTKLQQHTLAQLDTAGANAGVLTYFTETDTVLWTNVADCLSAVRCGARIENSGRWCGGDLDTYGKGHRCFELKRAEAENLRWLLDL